MKERLSETEVALSHPFRDLAVRLTDDGKVALLAGDHCGIVFDEDTGAVTLYGTSISFVAQNLNIDGYPVDKMSLISRAKHQAGKFIDVMGLKKAIRKQS